MLTQQQTLKRLENWSPEKRNLFAKLWEEEKEVRRHETFWDHPALADPAVFEDYREWRGHQAHLEYLEKVAALEAQRAKRAQPEPTAAA